MPRDPVYTSNPYGLRYSWTKLSNMPGGYRKTHNYPQGKPFPLVLLDIAVAIFFAMFTPTIPYRSALACDELHDVTEHSFS
jgi:hypothetical protein